jgi:hypothetical protein
MSLRKHQRQVHYKDSWERKMFAKAASATKGKTQNKGEELLIMNY